MAQRLCGYVLVLTTALWSLSLRAQEARGTLEFSVKPYTSEVELTEKTQETLKAGGVDWGLTEKQLVISLVNRRFIKFDLSQSTRYGENKTLQLEPGMYRLTCAGFIIKGGYSVEKALEKGAYFNLDVLTFRVDPGKTTTIEVLPTIKKRSTFLVNMFTPDLLVKIIQDGTVTAERVINERTAASVAWGDYKGPLKF